MWPAALRKRGEGGGAISSNGERGVGTLLLCCIATGDRGKERRGKAQIPWKKRGGFRGGLVFRTLLMGGGRGEGREEAASTRCGKRADEPRCRPRWSAVQKDPHRQLKVIRLDADHLVTVRKGMGKRAEKTHRIGLPKSKGGCGLIHHGECQYSNRRRKEERVPRLQVARGRSGWREERKGGMRNERKGR